MGVLRRQASEAVLLYELDGLGANVEMLPVEGGWLNRIAEIPSVRCNEVVDGSVVIIKQRLLPLLLLLLVLSHGWFSNMIPWRLFKESPHC